ncbi:SDR family oxidoreductase [Bordetella muralis]|jgi:gluconate 5-dehydrogenase|uniref:SDR family oxidoreductase n=1 Tax=Bordetella muralis TaxID=1649130 RepID=UPI0039EE1011
MAQHVNQPATPSSATASSLFDLSGRRVLVTGSSQGLGYALARGLAQHGATVIMNARNAARLNEAVQRLRGEGLSAHALPFDVTDPAAAQTGINGAESEFGPIDILVNNAGMQHRGPLEQFPVDQWDALMRTNISSIFYVSKPAATHMIARGRGKIINIASVQSELARPGIAPYTATKGAVRNLTRGMATDWARHGLQINAIAPGYFRTELTQALVDNPDFTQWLSQRTPAGRWGNPEELVGAAVFLASDASSFVNGHTLYVDGGMTASV